MNYAGFRFRAPVSLNNNAFIARIDYHLDSAGKHTLFWRGALQNIFNPQAPFLPGAPPEQTLTDHSKGFVVGYTAVLSPTVVNTFHYGFTRQSTGIIASEQPVRQAVIPHHQGSDPPHTARRNRKDRSWVRTLYL